MSLSGCKLCLKQKKLRDSHLIPAAIYRLCRNELEDVPDPIGIRSDSKTNSFRLFQTSRQVTGYVLCPECEQLLNANGEGWVLPTLATVEKFPLYEMMSKVQPDFREDDLDVFYASKLPSIR